METFVVRLWAPVEVDGRQPGGRQLGGPPLHGVVEHVGRGIVWARGAASPVNACVEPRTGYLKLGSSCGGGQQLTWNVEGPAGPAGPKGDPGPTGPAGPAGPKGDQGKGPAKASKAEVVARTTPLARLKHVTGRASAAKLGKLGASTGGTLALSAFHDDPVVIPSILNKLGTSSPWEMTVAHLDVPAGKYVVVAKALAMNTSPNTYSIDETAGVLCFLAAGVDSDAGSATHWNTLSLTVVHAFAKPGRIELNCTSATVQTVMALENVKITAVRVATLSNGYVAAG
jgi:hypothetical protein